MKLNVDLDYAIELDRKASNYIQSIYPDPSKIGPITVEDASRYGIIGRIKPYLDGVHLNRNVVYTNDVTGIIIVNSADENGDIVLSEDGNNIIREIFRGNVEIEIDR